MLMSNFFFVCYIICVILSILSLITAVYVGIKRLNTVRVLPKALRLYLLFSCFPFFITTSLSSLYIAVFYLSYETLNHYTVDFVRHVITFSSQQIRNAFIMIMLERIFATIELDNHKMADKIGLFSRFTAISYLMSSLYLGYNVMAKSMPDKPYLANYVSYYVYATHLFMFSVCAILYLANRRMYKLSAYQITLKKRHSISQNVRSLKYLFPIILIYCFFAQFGSMNSIIFQSLGLPTPPITTVHIFFNIAYLLIYYRHYCIKTNNKVQDIAIIKNALGKVIPIDANADQYFNGLQHQWKK